MLNAAVGTIYIIIFNVNPLIHQRRILCKSRKDFDAGTAVQGDQVYTGKEGKSRKLHADNFF